MAQAKSDPALARSLRLVLAGTDGGTRLATEAEKRLRTIQRSRGFIEWDKVRPLVRELEGLRETIAGPLAQADPRAAAALATKHGEAHFAVGNRVQFTETRRAGIDKKQHIYNGNAGVITGIDARTGQVAAKLDTAAGTAGREVTWSAAKFQGFRHVYAGTITRARARRWTTRICCTRSTGERRRATWRSPNSAKVRKCSLPKTRPAMPGNSRAKWAGAR